MMRFARISAWVGLCSLWATVASAQGLVLRLPADGTWVRYEGTYTQTEIRPTSTTGKLEIPAWAEHVTIKSVGSEMADFRGETVPCRWIEIKVERGREADGKIDVGVTGLEIYKVLIPESAVLAEPKSADGVPASFTPVVKGYRQLGKGMPQPIHATALKLYPLAMLLGYCRDFQVEEQDVDPGVSLPDVKANVLAGTATLERPDSQSVLESKVWSSEAVPFGVAAWTSKITRSIKDAQEPRDAFQPRTETVAEMKARATGTDAQSELQIP